MKIDVFGLTPNPVAARPGTPTGGTKTGEITQFQDVFPHTVAARGPLYDVGPAYYPYWAPNVLAEEKVVFIPGNYGQAGSLTKYANNSTPGDPLVAGSEETATARVRSLRWDPEALPGFDPRIAPWNILPKGEAYQVRVPSVKSNAGYGNSVAHHNIQQPLDFTPPTVASLVSEGLHGN